MKSGIDVAVRGEARDGIARVWKGKERKQKKWRIKRAGRLVRGFGDAVLVCSGSLQSALP